LRIYAERFRNVPELAFRQMTPPGYVPSQAALSYVAEPLAEFFMRDISAQQFNLYQ
jgi:hypothetical protein